MAKDSCLIFVLFLSSVGCVSQPNKFIVRFALSKARDACAGERFTNQLENYVQRVLDQCQYGPSRRFNNVALPFQPTFDRGTFNPSFNSNSRFTPYVNSNFDFNNRGTNNYLERRGSFSGGVGSALDNREYFGHGGSNNRLNPSYDRRFSRLFKRSVDDADDKEGKRLRNRPATYSDTIDVNQFNSLLNELEAKISNITCVLTTAQIIDERGDLMVQNMVKLSKQFGLGAKLQTEITKGIYDCGKIANCEPRTDSTLIPATIERAINFLKCSQNKRYEACLKSDIRDTIIRSIPRDTKVPDQAEFIIQAMSDFLKSEKFDDFEHLLL